MIEPKRILLFFLTAASLCVVKSAAADWYSPPPDTDKYRIRNIINRSVSEALDENQGQPVPFRDIPTLEKSWKKERKSALEAWRRDLNALHREWRIKFSKLSNARTGHARRKLLKSSIAAAQKKLDALHRQLSHEKQLLEKRLAKISHPVMLYGKTELGTGDFSHMRMSQVTELIKQRIGSLAVDKVVNTYIRNLSPVRDNLLIRDMLKKITNVRYDVTSIFPEDVAILNRRYEEWVYLFCRVDVFPFARAQENSTGKKKTSIIAGVVESGNRFQILDLEKTEQPVLDRWLQEEISNIEKEKRETEDDIQSAFTAFSHRKQEIAQDIDNLKNEIQKRQSEFASLPAENELKKADNDFSRINGQYRSHYSSRIVMDARKLSKMTQGRRNMEDTFRSMVMEAWNSYELHRNDYPEEVLVEDPTLGDYTSRHINRQGRKTACKIIFLARREIGSYTEYVASIGIKVKLEKVSRESEYRKINSNLNAGNERGHTYYDVANVNKNDVLNIRGRGHYKSNLVGKIPYNGKCLIFLNESTPVGKSNWYMIEYNDMRGWVNSHFLKESRKCP